MPIIRNSFLKKQSDEFLIYTGDPYYNNVELLLDFENQATGSGTLKDKSKNRLLYSSNSLISSTQKKFGKNSLYLTAGGFGSNIDIKNQDFTLEAWIYSVNGFAQNAALFTTNPTGTGYQMFGVSNNRIAFWNELNVSPSIIGNINLTPNEWAHIAFSKKNSTLYIFVNGILDVTIPYSSPNVPQNIVYFNTAFSYQQNVSIFINKYADNIRITKGVGRYTSNFIPQDFEKFIPKINFLKSNSNKKITFNKKPRGSIYTEDPYYDKVALLLDFENGLVDESKYNHSITTFGDLAVSEVDKKFGAKSLQVSNNYLEIQNTNGAFNLGDQDFTIECWIKGSQGFYYTPFVTFLNSSNDAIHRFGGRFSSLPPNGGDSVFIDINNNGYSLNDIYIPGYNTNSWYHYAVVRGNGKLYFYIDGVLQTFNSGFTSNLNFLNINQPLQNIDKIWINRASTFIPNYINGYIDNIRITVGHARYIYPNNFTPEDFQKYQYIPPITV